MKQHKCNSITTAGEQCTRNSIRGSKYCWHHEDLAGIANFLSFFIGVVISFGLTWWGVDFAEARQQAQAEALRSKRVPQPTVSLHQSAENKIVVEIISTNAASAPTEDLFFKFDIPGKSLCARIH